jgi:hypothetical protein
MGARGRVVAHMILLPVASIVVVARQLIETLALVDELTELEHEETGALPVGQQHREPLVLIDHPLELTDVRGVVHGQVVVHRYGQLDHAPEVVRAAREDRQSSGA